MLQIGVSLLKFKKMQELLWSDYSYARAVSRNSNRSSPHRLQQKATRIPSTVLLREHLTPMLLRGRGNNDFTLLCWRYKCH